MTTETKHDPDCHMDIDPATAFGSSEHEAVTYYFCSRGCKVDFDEDPAAVLKAESEYDHSQPMQHAMMATPAPAGKPWWKFWG
jgi:YHS domain-containing protein